MVDRNLTAVVGRWQITLRRARLRDLPALLHLEKLCFDQDAWGSFGLLWALLSPRNVNLLAEFRSRIVGLIVGEKSSWCKQAIIANLAVHPGFRRRGLGGHLLKTCESITKWPGYYLTVRNSNAAAIALYENSGYIRIGVRRYYYAGGEDPIEMQKTAKD